MNFISLIRIGAALLFATFAIAADRGAPVPAAAAPAKPTTTAARTNKLDRVKFGMTERQVLALCGAPTIRQAGEWGYGNDGWVAFTAQGVVAIVRKGQPLKPRQANLSVTGLRPSGESVDLSYRLPPNLSTVHVRGYTRADGTYVAPHARTAPNSTRNDNYSTRGNVNPHTGKAGTKPRDGERSEPVQYRPSRAELESRIVSYRRLMDLYVRQTMLNTREEDRITGKEYDEAKEACDRAENDLKHFKD